MSELLEIDLENIFPTKTMQTQIKKGRKYAQILSSIREMGLIEAPVVTPFRKGKGYLLLDGHLRMMALAELGQTKVVCLISTDDEAYTYNKYINKLSPIQEHRMLVRAVEAGISEEKLANTLNLNWATIRNKINLLDGICPEVAEILKDKHVSEPVFRILRKMKAPRQITVAMLMNDQNRFTVSYAQALLDTTPHEQLVNNCKPKKATPAILARQARLEEENIALSQDIETLKSDYCTDMVNVTSVQAYLKHLLDNNDVSEYLKEFHEPIYEKFKEISLLDFFKLHNL